jgi:hypothetical protein
VPVSSTGSTDAPMTAHMAGTPRKPQLAVEAGSGWSAHSRTAQGGPAPACPPNYFAGLAIALRWARLARSRAHLAARSQGGPPKAFTRRHPSHIPYERRRYVAAAGCSSLCREPQTTLRDAPIPRPGPEQTIFEAGEAPRFDDTTTRLRGIDARSPGRLARSCA